MAETGRLTRAPAAILNVSPVLLLRIAIITTIVVVWEAVAASGLLFRDVVPSLFTIGAAIATILLDPDYYRHLWITLAEVATAMLIGGSLGLAAGLALGANRFLSEAFERYLYYLGPTPKIIFFPIMIMWFGVGPGSKVAMGAVSCFFPIVLCAAAGVREIDQVLIRVGKSFRANAWQTASKIYLPAMRQAILNGVRLGLGIALIGTLLAETKLSNFGIGFLIMQAYFLFDMPRMYATLIVLFVLAIGANAWISRLGRIDPIRQS